MTYGQIAFDVWDRNISGPRLLWINMTPESQKAWETAAVAVVQSAMVDAVRFPETSQRVQSAAVGGRPSQVRESGVCWN